MKKIFLLVPHNNPSGGTKVANQIVNLFIEHKYESFLVTLEAEPKKATFMKEPAPVININDFKKICAANDIVITFWQHPEIELAVKNCSAQTKIFWQHGIIIPRYGKFNGEEIYYSGNYNQFWNVSAACANYIKDKYKLPEIKIVHPFFDDKTLLEYQAQKDIVQKDGILFLRRRGQEAIPEIISRFPEQKITILNRTFSDDQLYAEIIKHKFFVSTDNSVYGSLLIKNKALKYLKQLKRLILGLFKEKSLSQSGWIRQEKNFLGFPMTAAEAAWLGTNVIAFAMGGGLEWMNKENIYLAKDNNMDSLLEKIAEALKESKETLKKKTALAEQDVKKFSKEKVWQQLSANLNLK